MSDFDLVDLVPYRFNEDCDSLDPTGRDAAFKLLLDERTTLREKEHLARLFFDGQSGVTDV